MRSRARAALFRIAINPCDHLRHQNDRGETEINNEEQVPGDAPARNRKPHARAERRHGVEEDVAGDADAVNQRKHCQRRRFQVAESAATDRLQPGTESARENSEKKREKRQADERVRDRAMVFDDAERIARKCFRDNVHVGENRAERRRKDGDSFLALGEKSPCRGARPRFRELQGPCRIQNGKSVHDSERSRDGQTFTGRIR